MSLNQWIQLDRKSSMDLSDEARKMIDSDRFKAIILEPTLHTMDLLLDRMVCNIDKLKPVHELTAQKTFFGMVITFRDWYQQKYFDVMIDHDCNIYECCSYNSIDIIDTVEDDLNKKAKCMSLVCNSLDEVVKIFITKINERPL